MVMQCPRRNEGRHVHHSVGSVEVGESVGHACVTVVVEGGEAQNGPVLLQHGGNSVQIPGM